MGNVNNLNSSLEYYNRYQGKCTIVVRNGEVECGTWYTWIYSLFEVNSARDANLKDVASTLIGRKIQHIDHGTADIPIDLINNALGFMGESHIWLALQKNQGTRVYYAFFLEDTDRLNRLVTRERKPTLWLELLDKATESEKTKLIPFYMQFKDRSPLVEKINDPSLLNELFSRETDPKIRSALFEKLPSEDKEKYIKYIKENYQKLDSVLATTLLKVALVKEPDSTFLSKVLLYYKNKGHIQDAITLLDGVKEKYSKGWMDSQLDILMSYRDKCEVATVLENRRHYLDAYDLAKANEKVKRVLADEAMHWTTPILWLDKGIDALGAWSAPILAGGGLAVGSCALKAISNPSYKQMAMWYLGYIAADEETQARHIAASLESTPDINELARKMGDLFCTEKDKRAEVPDACRQWDNAATNHKIITKVYNWQQNDPIQDLMYLVPMSIGGLVVSRFMIKAIRMAKFDEKAYLSQVALRIKKESNC